jgi:phosphomevalonate kinase
VKIRATAPGKLVVLGEYAVLAGAPALVLAVDRRCQADIGPSEDDGCQLRIRAPESRETSFPVGATSGVALVDLVTSALEADGPLAWRAGIDSSGFFDGETKLGIGSSAAVLTAWAAAWSVYAGRDRIAPDAAGLEQLISLHRKFQGGMGSGLDVAASLFGGVITYLSAPGGVPCVGSVRLPNSVVFSTVFTGRSAATTDFVSVFDDWRVAKPAEADRQLQALERISADGCAAAREDDADEFLTAVAGYGQRLEDLGRSMGAEIVTAEHREIARHAKRFGVAYKVSGAGGGDLGIAFSADPEALAAFKEAAGEKYGVVEFRVDTTGLSIEEEPD